jgi:DNA invertase Pin-like site-specific DNA recombinase
MTDGSRLQRRTFLGTLLASLGAKLLFDIMARFAEFEREQITDNVRAGMARAKAQDKFTHRSPITETLKQRVLALCHEGIVTANGRQGAQG